MLSGLYVWCCGFWQELDGSFNHMFKVEENQTKFEILCHSKSRRNKKKKIPLMNGEEVDMDLSAMDSDSPVLWISIDPDMQLLRQVCMAEKFCDFFVQTMDCIFQQGFLCVLLSV